MLYRSTSQFPRGARNMLTKAFPYIMAVQIEFSNRNAAISLRIIVATANARNI
jgi:hypothetical protein